jgi:hypothetical protein
MEELRENPGTPFRPPAVAMLTIDSRDRVRIDPATGYRIDTTSPYQILINKGQSVMNGFFTRVAVTEINMQWNSPNVIESGPCKNNTLTFEEDVTNTTYTVEIDEGFYTPEALATAIQNNLNAGAGAFGCTAWTVAYNRQTNIFVIEIDSPTINPPLIRIRPENVGFNDDLLNIMGLSYPPSTFALRIAGSYASMIYTPYFDIVSDSLTKKQNVRDNGTSFLTGQNLLARVYLAEPGINSRLATSGTPLETNVIGSTPFNLYRDYNTPKQIYWDAQEFINVIDLRLVDYKGRTLYSQPQLPGSEVTQAKCGEAAQFQLTLQVTET